MSRYDYIPHGTKIITDFPSPWGWFEIEWWSYGDAPITMLMVAVGLAMSLWAVVQSTSRWWLAVSTYVATNMFFIVFTLTGGIGCIGDGCEFAQAQGIALTWQAAAPEISLAFMLAIGLLQVSNELCYKDAPLWLWLKGLSAEHRCVVLAAPMIFLFVLPLGCAIIAGCAGNQELFNLLTELFRSSWLWKTVWTLSMLPASIGLIPYIQEEIRREFCGGRS